MSPFIIFMIVLAGAGIGYIRGLIIRMKTNPEIQGKRLKVLFQKDRDHTAKK